MAAETKVPIILHTDDYRGDHAADIRRIIMVSPDETVASLMRRREKAGRGSAWIEITGVDHAEADHG